MNAVPGFLAIQHDITEHKRAEEKIQEQAALLDNAQDAIGVVDLERNLLFWNKGSERLYGWAAEEVIGKKAPELLYAEQLLKVLESVLVGDSK
jgi:PAS domain-containing protein